MIDTSPFREPEDWETEKTIPGQGCFTCVNWSEESIDEYGISHGRCALFKDKPGYGPLWSEYDGEDCSAWELEEAIS